MSGDESGNFDPNTGRFKAPVSGRYSFGLSLMVYGGGGGGYDYNILLMKSRDEITKHDMYASGTRSGSNNDGRFFTTELELNKDEYVYYVIYDSSSGLTYGRSQTYFEGKLIKAT